MAGFLFQATVFLVAMVIAVPLAARLGFGSVLGYLAAGLVIGPVLGLVGGHETAELQHVAEFGVVMMLFLIGLELEPRALWDMRHRLLGLGGLQITLTTLTVMVAAIWLGQIWTVALAIGLIFALSSTAIVLQTLNEKGLIQTGGGRSAFSVLLTQDIAVIPILALLPLLALPRTLEQVFDASRGGAEAAAHGGGAHEAAQNFIAGLPGWAELTDSGRELARERLLDHYAGHCWDSSRPFAGIETLIGRLRSSRAALGIVTNKISRFADTVVDCAGWADRFGCLITGDRVERPKPDPEPVLAACRALGVGPEQTLVVGDDRRDVLAGAAAGADTVVAAWGYIPAGEQPGQWGADAVIETPLQLLELLEQHEVG